MNIWTGGNAAKLYCLDRIAQLITQRGGRLSIADLGCGDGLHFASLLRAFPQVCYVGLDPDASACARAKTALRGCNADIRTTPVYDVAPTANERFDVVVSFSVLEHVYQRPRYLRTCVQWLQPGTVMYLNYDAGHFLAQLQGNYPWRERFRDWRRSWRAKRGNEADYQAFVRENDFRTWLNDAGLAIQEEKFFNLYALKELSKAVPKERRDEYLRQWVAYELSLNSAGVPYTDRMAQWFGTRNFVLTRRD